MYVPVSHKLLSQIQCTGIPSSDPKQLLTLSRVADSEALDLCTFA